MRSTKNRPAATVTFRTTRRTRAKDIIPRVWPNTDASGATIEVHGLLCTSPEALFAQTTEELSLEDLIEFGDSLVCRDPARRRTTLAELRKFIHSCDSFQGQKQCIRALTQIRENTDSPAETHLRLLLKRYGFPEPIINVPVEATGNAAHGPAISDGLRPTQSGLAVAWLVRRDSTLCCRLAAHDHVAAPWS